MFHPAMALSQLLVEAGAYRPFTSWFRRLPPDFLVVFLAAKLEVMNPQKWFKQSAVYMYFLLFDNAHRGRLYCSQA